VLNNPLAEQRIFDKKATLIVAFFMD